MKTILITGASRGIGRATALPCGARGWSVAINYVRDEHAAEETAQAVQKAGGCAVTVRDDVSAEADAIGMFDSAENRLGSLNGVVINAAIVAAAQTLTDVTAERLKRTFEVNIFGAYLCARESALDISGGR